MPEAIAPTRRSNLLPPTPVLAIEIVEELVPAIWRVEEGCMVPMPRPVFEKYNDDVPLSPPPVVAQYGK